MTAFKEKLRDTSLFRVIYIFDLFFCMVSFVQVAAYVLLPFLFIWGLWLVFCNQRRFNTFFKMRFGIWIGAFLAFSLITMLLNLTETLLFSLIMQLHVLICFFVFYGMHTEPDFDFKRELNLVAKGLVILTTALNVVGFFCLLFGIHFEWNFEDIYWIYFPIYENRFTGVFFNPNLLGFVSVAAVVCCHMMTKDGLYSSSKTRRPGMGFIYACVVINIFALILSDSNASIVLALGYVCVYITYVFFDRREGLTPSRVFIKIITLLLVLAVFVSSSLMLRTVFKAGFTVITSRTNALVDVLFDDKPIEGLPDKEEKEEEEKPEITFDHENTNIDSGRFRLWQESIDLFKISPVFGISHGNIVFYSEEYLSGVLQYNYHHNDLHNGFLTIIVSTGVIGALLFGTFGFRFAKHAAQHLFLRRKSVRAEVYPCLFSFLAAYMGYAFFEKALLYDISFLVMFFWLIMGYTSCYVAKYEHLIETQYLFHQKRLRRTML